MEKVENKLAEMENQGVISKVEPTEQCSGLVVVSNPSGDVDLCVDLTGLNKAARCEAHPMATVKDSLAKLSGSRVFRNSMLIVDFDRLNWHQNRDFELLS